jgi:hypothetical protein
MTSAFSQLYAGGGDRTRMGSRPKDFKGLLGFNCHNDLAVPPPTSARIRAHGHTPSRNAFVTRSDTLARSVLPRLGDRGTV